MISWIFLPRRTPSRQFNKFPIFPIPCTLKSMSSANDNLSSALSVDVASVANRASASSQNPPVGARVEVDAVESAANARLGGQLPSLTLSPIHKERRSDLVSFSLSPMPGPTASV